MGTYYCDCPEGPSSDLFPTLKIIYERFTLNVNPKDYFLYEKDPLSGKFRCRLTFRKEMKDMVDYWLLGDPFLRAFYTIYDIDEDRIGFVGNITSKDMQFSDII